MKIFLPFKVKDIGGTSSFALKFKKGMEDAGHEVSFEFQEDYDLLFLIVQCPFKYLRHAKKNKRKIIQRLDGCWYYTVAGWKYWLYNLKAKIIRHAFTDYTVYQSKYSQYCANKFLGKKSNDLSLIIYNGVDLNLFSPEEQTLTIKDNSKQAIFFTASQFRRKDQIEPILKALEIYHSKYNQNFKCLIAGSFSKKVANFPQLYANLNYVKFLGKIENSKLPEYEKTADVFLFSHLNPPCPNNVIEAMACGLPICGVADGSMQEITVPGKNSLLIGSKGNAFWTKRNYDVERFADNLNLIVKNLDFYSKNSRQIAEESFSLDKMIDNYLKIL